MSVRGCAEACAHCPFCFPQPPTLLVTILPSWKGLTYPTLGAFKSLLNCLPRQVETLLTPDPT